MQDPQPMYNRGEDYNETVSDIQDIAAWAIAMGDLTSLTECMKTIHNLCEKTQTDPVD